MSVNKWNKETKQLEPIAQNSVQTSPEQIDDAVNRVAQGKQDRIQFAMLPAATAELEGKIYQYSGETDATYTSGVFYKCVSDGSDGYEWSEVSDVPDEDLDADSDNSLKNKTITAIVKSLTDEIDALKQELASYDGLSFLQIDEEMTIGDIILNKNETSTTSRLHFTFRRHTAGFRTVLNASFLYEKNGIVTSVEEAEKYFVLDSVDNFSPAYPEKVRFYPGDNWNKSNNINLSTAMSKGSSDTGYLRACLLTEDSVTKKKEVYYTPIYQLNFPEISIVEVAPSTVQWR